MRFTRRGFNLAFDDAPREAVRLTGFFLMAWLRLTTAAKTLASLGHQLESCKNLPQRFTA